MTASEMRPCPKCGQLRKGACVTCWSNKQEAERVALIDTGAKRQGKPKLQLLDTARMLSTEPEPIKWLVDGVLARGYLTMLAGREKEGKSLISLGMGAAIASGGGKLGAVECHAGRVLIVDAENGEREIHRRLRALGLQSADMFSTASARGFNLRKDLGELRALIEHEHPDLVVLDSFRSLWQGEENDAGEVAEVLDELRSTLRDSNVAGLLLHHMNKGGAYRGSTAVGASVENIVELARVQGDPDRRRRRLRNPACRFEEEAPDRWLRIEVDRRLGCLFIEQAEPYVEGGEEREPKPPPLRARLAEQIEAMLEEDVGARVKDLCLLLERDEKDASIRRALRGLEGAGKARRDAGRWWKCQVSGVNALGGPDTLTPDTTALALVGGGIA